LKLARSGYQVWRSRPPAAGNVDAAYLLETIWRGRTSSGDAVFQRIIPGIFVLGGTIAELVALYGVITGTVWRT
jgi:hypothetical protein